MEPQNQYRLLDIASLKPYEKNARKHTRQQIAKIKESISTFNFVNDVIVDENNLILCGHGRVAAAKKLGLKQVPCKVVSHLTDAQKRAYMLADNRLAELAEWDMGLVQAELDDLAAELDVGVVGFDAPEDADPRASVNPSGEKEAGFSYKEQYGVIVMCEDEAHQKEVYESLSGMGYDCKVVAT